jgi:hypothetical protein
MRHLVALFALVSLIWWAVNYHHNDWPSRSGDW